LTDGHAVDDAYGADSPFSRLVEAGGHVLLLGAPLDTATLLHHAEAIARVSPKRRVTFRIPVAEDAGVVERTYTDIDTSKGAFPYEEIGLDEDEFTVIVRAALAAGIGVSGRVGQAESHLLPAAELVRFGVAWMEERFGGGGR
jgi:aminoglycoside 3-N-acetyltransferase